MIDIPRIKESQVPRHRFHGFERVSLEHLGTITIAWKFFAPCEVVFGGLPLSVVDERVPPWDLVEENVPSDLSDNVADFPVRSLLYVATAVNDAIG